MKAKFLLPLILMFVSLTGFSTTWTITNLGSAFKPALITIAPGDSVLLSITNTHNCVEVSKATWDANANTPLPGFSTPYGGGLLLPVQLAIGTHYYVCTPHAVWGMKGTIIVQNVTGNTEVVQKSNVSVYPNPSNGIYHITINGLQSVKDGNIEVFNVVGERVFRTGFSNSTVDVDLSNSSKGIYFMKIFDGQNVNAKRIVKQ
jgi:plastocyanin